MPKQKTYGKSSLIHLGEIIIICQQFGKYMVGTKYTCQHLSKNMAEIQYTGQHLSKEKDRFLARLFSFDVSIFAVLIFFLCDVFPPPLRYMYIVLLKNLFSSPYFLKNRFLKFFTSFVDVFSYSLEKFVYSLLSCFI